VPPMSRRRDPLSFLCRQDAGSTLRVMVKPFHTDFLERSLLTFSRRFHDPVKAAFARFRYGN